MTRQAAEPSSTGLDPNIAAAIAYLAGFITGIVMLVVEKKSRYVRFHAMQSTVFFLAVLVLSIVINSIPLLGAFLYAFLLFPAVVIIWLVLLYKAYNGEWFKLPVAGEFSEKQI